ncbi:MAG: hypothetical protein SVV03_01010, partial [Candidatus Nanohaloarchaea archaeon]|nr:hypothetical protein [Candidatus Nanohaloarchaea archaeon]
MIEKVCGKVYNNFLDSSNLDSSNPPVSTTPKVLASALLLLTILTLTPTFASAATQFTVENQSGFNQGNFNMTSADRANNSGNLGIGYLNGTASDSLIGFWRFDKTTGNAKDYSGNQNNGKINGTTRGVTGIFSTNSYKFDGNDTIEIPSNTDFDLTNATFSTWINTEKYNQSNLHRTTNYQILSRHQAGDSTKVNGYELGITSEEKPYLTLENITQQNISKTNNNAPSNS